MLGNNVLTCIHSEWNGIKPQCLGLNQENDYASMLPLNLCLIKFELLNHRFRINITQLCCSGKVPNNSVSPSQRSNCAEQ